MTIALQALRVLSQLEETSIASACPCILQRARRLIVGLLNIIHLGDGIHFVNFTHLRVVSLSAHDERMRILILPLGERFIVEVFDVKFLVLLDLNQIKHIFVGDGCEEHAEEEDNRASNRLNLHASRGKEGSHADLIEDDHEECSDCDIVYHLAARLNLPPVIRKQVVRVDLMPHLDEHCCSNGNEWYSWRVENANSEDGHDLRVKVTIQERKLFFSPPGCGIIEDFSFLNSDVRQEVECGDVTEI